MNKKLLLFFGAIFCLATATATAAGIDKNTAKMQAMDKITGRVSVIYVPVGGMVNFGSLSIVIRACKTRPMEETPDNFAFADISDKTLKGDDVNIFRGWMISSSPATHAVEHPIYDVWLLSCLDKKVDKTLLLSEEQLAAHENLPSQNQSDDATENNTKPIAEMQEDESAQKKQTPQPTEFSYDEADEAEEMAEEDEAENGDDTETDTDAEKSADEKPADNEPTDEVSSANELPAEY